MEAGDMVELYKIMYAHEEVEIIHHNYPSELACAVYCRKLSVYCLLSYPSSKELRVMHMVGSLYHNLSSQWPCEVG